jgi:hypothetical protein
LLSGAGIGSLAPASIFSAYAGMSSFVMAILESSTGSLHTGLADFDDCSSDYSCHGVVAIVQAKGFKGKLIGFGQPADLVRS